MIDKKAFDIVKEAHKMFLREPGKDTYVNLRQGDERYIDYTVLKDNWYYGSGSYVLFCGTVKEASFSVQFISELVSSEDIEKQAKKLASETKS
jgi:hypothetical protein